MGIENLLGYESSYSGTELTITKNKITALQMVDDDYVRKTYGVGKFGDWRITFDGQIASTTDNTGQMQILFSDNVAHISNADIQSANKGFTLYFREDAADRVYLKEYLNDTIDTYICNSGQTYYFDFKRVGSSVTLKIYTDAARTNLADTLTLSCALTFNYWLPMATKGQYGQLVDGFFANFDMHESKGKSSRIVVTEGVIVK